VNVALCRDIMETGSALVVPDFHSFGVVVPGRNGRTLRFFAGVPLSNGAITVGALCWRLRCNTSEEYELAGDGAGRSVHPGVFRREDGVPVLADWLIREFSTVPCAKVKHFGLSEAGVKTICRAHAGTQSFAERVTSSPRRRIYVSLSVLED
jgi:hypothetical protein